MILIGYESRRRFQPKNLASCVGQYNQQNAAGALGTWRDAKGVMGDFTAAGSARPTVSGGWVVFDGVDDVMTLAANYGLADAHTIAMRVKIRSSGVNVIVGDGIGGGLTQSAVYTNGTVLVYLANFAAGPPSENSGIWSFPTDCDVTLVVVRTPTAVRTYVDGLLVSTVTTTAGSNWSMQAVGAYMVTAFPTDISIRSMAFFNAALSDSDRTRVERWLGQDSSTPETSNLLLGLDDTDATKFLTTSNGSTMPLIGEPVGRWNPARWAPATHALQATAGQRCTRGTVGVTADTGKWLDLSTPLVLSGDFTVYWIGVQADGLVFATGSSTYIRSTLVTQPSTGSVIAGNDAGDTSTVYEAWDFTLSVFRWRRSGSSMFFKWQGNSEVAMPDVSGAITFDQLMARTSVPQYQDPTAVTRATLVYGADCGATGFAATEAWTQATYGVVA